LGEVARKTDLQEVNESLASAGGVIAHDGSSQFSSLEDSNLLVFSESVNEGSQDGFLIVIPSGGKSFEVSSVSLVNGLAFSLELLEDLDEGVNFIEALAKSKVFNQLSNFRKVFNGGEEITAASKSSIVGDKVELMVETKPELGGVDLNMDASEVEEGSSVLNDGEEAGASRESSEHKEGGNEELHLN